MNAQQEFILVQLSQAPDGLTMEELCARTDQFTAGGLQRTLDSLVRFGFIREDRSVDEPTVHHLTEDGRFVVRWMVRAPAGTASSRTP